MTKILKRKYSVQQEKCRYICFNINKTLTQGCHNLAIKLIELRYVVFENNFFQLEFYWHNKC